MAKFVALLRGIAPAYSMQRRPCAASVTPTSPANDPGGWLERRYGKEMTSRSAQTVERILRKMEEG